MRLSSAKEHAALWRERRGERRHPDLRDVARAHILNACCLAPWAEAEERLAVEIVRRLRRIAAEQGTV
jgi:hypothetical protein